MDHTTERVVLTTDVVIVNDRHEVLIMRRNTEPFKGTWVLPGGIVEVGETVEQAAIREVKEEVGLDVAIQGLLGVYSQPGRDPRGAFVSIAFRAKLVGGHFQANEEASGIAWIAPDQVDRTMGFDHAAILADHWRKGS